MDINLKILRENKRKTNIKQMVNYQNGQIYIMKCNTTNLVYIGSTAQKKLSVRIGGHKRSYKLYLKNNKNYCSSFKIIEKNNYTYETLEFYKCNCKKELEERERFYIEDYKNKYNDLVINKLIPTRTHKERHINNREQNLERMRVYHLINKDERNLKRRLKRKQEKELI